MSGRVKRARRAEYQGVLQDGGPGLGRWLVLSAVLHLLLFVPPILGWGEAAPQKPRLDRDAYMVSAVVLPKAVGLPDKAQAPRPKPPGDEGRKPAPPPEPDRMVLKQKEKEKEEGPTPKPQATPKPEPTPEPKSRSRADLLAGLNVEEGDTVRFATDPDGSENADPRDALRARFGRTLTGYQRIVHDRVKDNWFPKGARGKPEPGLEAFVQFTIDDSGQMSAPAVVGGSGDWIYDQSCVRAVVRTGRVPPPPAGEARDITLMFRPEDKP